MDEVSPFAELLGQLIYQYTSIKPFLPTYGHLLVSALFPIFIGAHASLSRPSSAAKPPKRDESNTSSDTDNEEEDEEEGQGPVQKMEGLEPSDALMFPLTAGLTLGGLYLIIKWLGDPAILNKILSFYFSQMGIFFAVAFLKDCLLVFRSFVFPRRYRYAGRIWKAKQSEGAFIAEQQESAGSKAIQPRRSPLPSILGSIPLPGTLNKALWACRNVAYKRVKVRAHVRGIFTGECLIGLLDIISAVLALSAVGYFAFVMKPWWLTNFLGFSFCYGALQFMSPSTFTTGSLILSSLFLYDIYFVFYTPLMVTVATKLDVPIKLLFPRPPAPGEAPDAISLAMLGLGDIVIPGMMAGLALRFDLFLYYKKKGVEKARLEGKGQELVKSQYQSATGGWGERFWAWSAAPRKLELEPPYQDAKSFPKPYFKASLVGYIAGMISTLAAMQYSNHPQPALLYLVPGVLSFLWGTALIRGELHDMWEFSDAEESEEEPAEEREGKKEEEKQDEPPSKNTKSLFMRILSGDIAAFYSEAPDSKEKAEQNSKHDETKGSAEKEKESKNKSQDSSEGRELDLVSLSISMPRRA
ncbi:aspartic endopeptidase [Aspergillus clavatus NRRL 1]|uniref:Signal peptide peptidase, putative n=1 Tax=Aspergillus clavatus (strain ATCC 1007 / CBS 513.65 / DSM 816 / NCTC 3887 / NRRL 1 / QM 1276 / 107) TaxID=344612 RepID=A1CMV3_ASPCL|nr:signal peptide peptidase, putative [Aspergillus clavatus NRRL 1]EAW08890.1 signal peptide peptidase, putative [Aspergillus clavatus NRRL 1]